MAKTKEEILYDENVKKFLSQKNILAHILKYCVKEFSDMEIPNIIPCIEGEPEISKMKVDASLTHMIDFYDVKSIDGMNTEDTSREEGKVFFDIRFYVRFPQEDELVKMFINVEAQNEVENLSYDIVTRGIYYCARMISSQKQREFVKSEYEKIKKVYSIWVCTRCKEEYRKDTITSYSVEQTNVVGHYPNKDKYDLMTVVVIGLAEEVAGASSEELKLHRLLETFFSSTLSKAEKRDIVENEYHIPYNEDIERSVEEMCNASQGVLNKGIEIGTEKGIEIGVIKGKIEAYHEIGMSASEIADKINISEKEVNDIISEFVK
ncbi:MAG: hypothetical protein ACLR5L_09510 [Clostridium sp.]